MPNVTLKISPENDPLGTPIETFTDEDITDLHLEISLYDLGQNTFKLPRRVWEASALKAREHGAYYVRVEIPYIKAVGAFWGFWLVAGEFVLTSTDEQGGEDVTIGGPGPLWYLTKARLNFREYTDHPGVFVHDGSWYFEGKTYGEILNILVSEDAASPRQAMPELDTPLWSASHDVDGNPWAEFGGIYKAESGTDYLSLLRDLQKADKLFAFMTPASLNLKAFDSYGNDLSGGAFGTGVVRFEKGTNIIGNLTRRNEKGQAYSHVMAVGTDRRVDGEVIEGHPIHGWFTSDVWTVGDSIRQGYLTYETNSLTVLERAALRYMKRSRDRTDRMIRVEVMPGQDEANGLYLPGDTATDKGNYWIGDTATFDTGGGNDLDLNEHDLVIAKITMELGAASLDTTNVEKERSWRVWLETGDDGRPSRSADSSLNTGSKAGANCACTRLCEATVPDETGSTEHFYTAETGGEDIKWDGMLVQGGSGNGAGGTDKYYFKSGAPDEWQETWAASAGDTYSVTGFIGCSSNGFLKLGFFTAAPGSDPPAVAALDSFTLTPAQPNHAHAPEWSGFTAGPFTAPVGTTSAALGRITGADFDQVSVILGGSVGSNPLAGIGEDAARCDHSHAVVSETDDPTVDDDAAAGFPVGTIWVNTATGDVFILTDSTEGAAVWLLVGSGTGTSGSSRAIVRDVSVMHRFMIGAHRGDIGSADSYPEDSLEAITQAALKGADVVEWDACQSADGTFWGSHDTTVDRCTASTGSISAKTDATLAALTYNAGFGYDAGRHGSSIGLCTLAEVIEALEQLDPILTIELKDGSETDLATEILAAGWGPRTVIEVPTLAQAANIKAVDVSLTVLVNQAVSGSATSGNVDWLSYDVTAMSSLADTQTKAPKVVKAYSPIADYGSDESADFQNAYDWGARCYQTNDLDAVLILRNALLYASVSDHGALTGLADDDHTQYTKKATLTTTGDIYYASSASTPARLGIGSASQVLSVSAGVPAWTTPASGTGIGEILISNTPSTPLVFADLLQNEAQDDLVYADP